MALVKLSQITNAESNLATGDQLVGVRSASLDRQFSYAQIANGLIAGNFFPTVLTSNLTLYVATTGNDLNNGLTPGTAFRTLQHAIDIAAVGINLGSGFVLTISLGAGSFAGAGLKQINGTGYVYINGAGVGSTTITAGPNDGLFNGGSCLSLFIDPNVDYYINNLTLDNSAGSTNCVLIGHGKVWCGAPVPSGLGPGDFTPGTVNFKGNASAYIVEIFDGTSVFADTPSVQPSTIGILSGTSSGMYKTSNAGFIAAQSNYTLTGTPNFSHSFALCYNNGIIAANNFAVVSGTGTGVKFDVHSNGVISGTGANVNLFPGSVAGTATDGGQYSA